MEELAARAVVVPASAVGEGPTTSIPRSEIQEVLDQDETPIELVLDVAHFKDGKATDTRSVAVSWERSELEELLRATEGENVTLTFDRETLRQAFASDVEAHGIRETVLALAVAATAATGAAASASAEPGKYLGTGTPPAASTQAGPEIPYLSHGQGVTPADLGIATGTSPDDQAVPRTDPAAASTQAGPEIPYLSHGQGVTPADLEIATGTAPDDRAVPRGAPVPPPELAPDDRAVPRSTPAPAPTSAPAPIVSPDDRAVPRSTPVEAPVAGTASDPGITWAPSPADTALIAGAIALAITGAFFIVGSGRRRIGPRPA